MSTGVGGIGGNRFDKKEYNQKNGWSEGLDRNISKIKMPWRNNILSNKEYKEGIFSEMNNIGKRMGFEVNPVGRNTWLEDSSIRTHDGFRYLPNENFDAFDESIRSNVANTSRRQSMISSSEQGAIAEWKEASSYERTCPEDNIIRGKSYLEGGNVLNTMKADGTPAAVIGQESLFYSLKSMGLDIKEENFDAAKQQIADDLHLDKENITFIPQLDFHIDMSFRPLHNGELAVPDYEQGIDILKNTDITGMSQDEKQELISRLSDIKEKADPIISDVVKKLEADGYKAVKIPSFTEFRDDNEHPINFMNGVGGTAENGESFYITNRSGYPELDAVMQDRFKEAGIDRTFFVSTIEFLMNQGGIDCLTQEM